MPKFNYQAVDGAQKTQRGELEADTAAAARSALRARGLLPVQVEPAKSGGLFSGNVQGEASVRLSPKMLALFTRQLATLLGSGVRVETTLETIASQSASAKIGTVSRALRANVLDGQSLGDAVARHPATFDRFYQACLAAGEVSGRLPQIAQRLADHVENAAKNRQAIVLALIYPALLALVSMAVVAGLLAFVVPDIVRAFSSRGADLPALTRALIGVSDWLNLYGLWVLGFLGIAIFGGARVLKIPAITLRWHQFLARFRLTRGPVLRLAGVQFTGTLATLLGSNVALADALGVAAKTVNNTYLRAQMDGLVKQVSDGAALSDAMNKLGIFQPMTIAMVVSGEASGDIASGLARSAEDQLADVNALVKTVVALVEPMVLLVMGGIVMLLVLAILLPIINLNAVVQ